MPNDLVKKRKSIFLTVVVLYIGIIIVLTMFITSLIINGPQETWERIKGAGSLLILSTFVILVLAISLSIYLAKTKKSDSNTKPQA